MDLKSFARKKNSKTPENGQGNGPSREELEKTVGELGKKSESELMSELMSEVQRGRSDGSFNNESLAEFMGKVSPMLTPEQRMRMEEITARLKM